MKKFSVWLNIITVALVLGLGVYSLLTIRLQTELLSLFPSKSPSVRGVRQSMAMVSSAQEITIVLTGSAAKEKTAERLEQELKTLPTVQAINVIGQRRLEPMVKMAAWGIVNLPPEKFTEFQSLFSAKQVRTRLQQTRDDLAGAVDAGELFLLQFDPLQILTWLSAQSHQSLPSPDFSRRENQPLIAMQVRATKPLRTFDECGEFVGRVRRAVRAVTREGAYITGQPAFVAENSGQMKSDMTLMVLLAVGLTSLLIFVFYRSASALVWMTLVLALALLVGVIAARVLFGELNVVSIGFASILIGLGSDYCILVYHFYATGQSDRGGDFWRTVRRGIWFSALATSLAFGALYFANFPGLQQLVALIAAGLLATAFFATTLLPRVLRRLRPVAPGWLTNVSDRFAEFEHHQRRKIKTTTALILLAAACLWPLARRYKFYDSDFNRLRPAHSEATRGLDALLEWSKSGRKFDVIVSARSWDELRVKASRVTPTATLLPQPDYLATNRAHWKPGNQTAFTSSLKDAGFDQTWGVATLQLLDTLDAWAAGAENFDSTRWFLSNVVETPEGEKVALLRLPMEDGPRETWSQVRQSEPTSLPANWQLMIEDMQQSVLADARRLSLWMLAAVVAISWWACRSWRQVALSGLALVLTFVGLLALLWFTRESMTLHSVLTVPVMVAVAIEYSLYMLLGLDANRGEFKPTFRKLAVPVLLMGLTTIIGFGAPVATHQPTLKNFGMVMAMGTFTAMLTGLVIVPAFYRSINGSPIFYRASWFGFFTRIAGRMSPTAARRWGAFLTNWYRRTHPDTTEVLRRNLAVVRGSGANGELTRRAFENFGRTMADYFVMGTRPRAEALALAEERRGFENLRAVIDEGEGALLVTAHLGLFELGSLLMEELGNPTVIVTLPEPTPALSKWRAAYRRRWGAETLEVGDDHFGFVEITRQLSAGKCVALLADRPHGDNFVLVDFPHGKVPFSTGPAWLSLLSGSPMIAVTVVATESGRYRVEAHAPIRTSWHNGSSRDETVAKYTLELAKIFREVICEYPDQWYQFTPLSPLR